MSVVAASGGSHELSHSHEAVIKILSETAIVCGNREAKMPGADGADSPQQSLLSRMLRHAADAVPPAQLLGTGSALDADLAGMSSDIAAGIEQLKARQQQSTFDALAKLTGLQPGLFAKDSAAAPSSRAAVGAAPAAAWRSDLAAPAPAWRSDCTVPPSARASTPPAPSSPPGPMPGASPAAWWSNHSMPAEAAPRRRRRDARRRAGSRPLVRVRCALANGMPGRMPDGVRPTLGSPPETPSDPAASAAAAAAAAALSGAPQHHGGAAGRARPLLHRRTRAAAAAAAAAAIPSLAQRDGRPARRAVCPRRSRLAFRCPRPSLIAACRHRVAAHTLGRRLRLARLRLALRRLARLRRLRRGRRLRRRAVGPHRVLTRLVGAGVPTAAERRAASPRAPRGGATPSARSAGRRAPPARAPRRARARAPRRSRRRPARRPPPPRRRRRRRRGRAGRRRRRLGARAV